MSSQNDDKEVEEERRLYPSRDVAVILLVDLRGRVLLVRTKRLPSRWQPIGGGIDATDSSVSAAAVRELAEEAGVKAEPEQLVPVFRAPYDFGEGTVHFFKLNIRESAALAMDRGELVEWRWVGVEEALKLDMFPATASAIKYLNDNPSVLNACYDSEDPK